LPRRRGNGEGSIYRRRDGTWAAAASLPEGRRRFVYGKTRDEVRRKLGALTRALATGDLSDARGVTVGDFLDHWLAEVVRPTVRHWTYVGYEAHVRLHIKPALGHIALDKLTPLQVQSFLNRRLEAGLSPKSVRYIRGTLRTALNKAIRWELLTRNVASVVDAPRVERYDTRPLDPTEARAFISGIRGDRLEALYSVALTMGLRQSEALGLRWRDVDLERGYLRVSKQLQRFDGQYHLVEPKTKRSRRTLVMPATIVEQLRDHQRRQLAGGRNPRLPSEMCDLVFTTPDGLPLDRTTVLREFHRHIQKAGLTQRRFHDLRHSCATLLLVQGVSPRVVMDVLGHSDVAVTMETYSHVIPELRRDAAHRMEELINDHGR
jgi:integrase